MQKLELILDILKTRSEKNLEICRVYRYLYNKEFYIEAYNKLSNNKGSLTPGVTKESIDGMSLKRINDIINEMKYERYKWNKTREVQIPKSNGKFRTLSLPEWRDKLVQEVLRMILSAIYEPKFSEASHGYRPNRGCHTALTRIYKKGQACDFFIEGDITDCFNSINHEILLNILKRDIDDGRFIELIRKMLKTNNIGTEFRYDGTYSGIPQGGVLSPLLTNIYLNEFDQWIEKTLSQKWNNGTIKAVNVDYRRLNDKICWREERYRKSTNQIEKQTLAAELKKMRQQRSHMKAKEKTSNCQFRRFTYTRYADDWIISFTGTYSESVSIKEQIQQYLKSSLDLNLNIEKTKITQSTNIKNPANFLGYNIIVQYGDSYMKHGKRVLGGIIGFIIPSKVITDKIRRYCKNGEPKARPELLNESVFDIIDIYQSELRGIIQYYKFARNQKSLAKLKYIMEVSLVKTLANKLKLSAKKVYDTYNSYHKVEGTLYKVLKCCINNGKRKVEAYFGGIPLKRKTPTNTEKIDDNIVKTNRIKSRSSLSQRLLNNVCEICGSDEDVEIHHIRKMSDIKNSKALWAKKMIALNRKTIALCHKHHMEVHSGKYDGPSLR